MHLAFVKWPYLFASASLLLLQACETTKTIEQQILTQVETLKAVQPGATAVQKEQVLDEVFVKTLADCKPVFTALEKRATTIRYLQLTVAIVGALAGTVGVPVFTASAAGANKTTIAALGGIAGMGNVFQETLTKLGLAPSQLLENREKIVNDWRQALYKYLEAKKKRDQAAMESAVIEAASACIAYSTISPS